jgi:hypothetical protein
MTRHSFTRTASLFLLAASLTATAQAQVFYTFTSGPGGDGFAWPASPTGIVDSDFFDTPDGIFIDNTTGNNVFFDSQYQVVGNGSRITGDALWGNPLDLNSGIISFDFNGLGFGGVQTLDFDFAWSEAGVPAVPDFVNFQVYDSDGRGTFDGFFLSDVFTGFGGGTGYEGTISLDASMFTDDDFNVDGGAFIDIELIEIYLDEITFGGNNSEFAIDNLATDGAGGPGGNGELFPSVSNGAIDVSGGSLGLSSLRGTGTVSLGVEVTNASGVATTFSTQIVPGGGLTDGGQISGQAIADGQSTFNPGLATLDRSQPTGTYESDITIINDGDPTDPDDTVTLSVNLLEAPLLSTTPDPVNVFLGEQATLTNAAAPVGGFRASVKFTNAIATTGPFSLISGFDEGTPVKPGEFAQATLLFNRFGQLSGTRTGQLIATVDMTTFAGINNDIEVLLDNAQPVTNQVWNLTYAHTDATADNANISTGFSYFQILGVNTFDVAATLIDGTSSKNQNFGMQIVPNPDPTSADLIGDAVDLIFGGGAGDQYTLQLTYEELALPAGATESDLQLLAFNTVSGQWEPAIDGNSAGTPFFFNGSYTDYLAGPGGGLFDAADLGAYGLDTLNNQVWAILDHASLFGVGVLTTALAGDLDGDGFVGINDLNIVLGNWNQNVPPANPLADPSGDGFVGIADLNVVLGNWNAGTPPASNAVPEPGTLAMLSLVGLTLLKRKNQTS